MDSDSANKSSKSSISLNLIDQTNSRSRRTQPKIFITLIIFFIVIIASIFSVLTMIKRDYDSELPTNNPEKAIKSICMPTRFYDTCFRYMSNSLYENKKSGSLKITSSQILSISLHTIIDDFQKITYLLKSYKSTESQCDYLYFNSSLSLLNSYLAIYEEKNSTAIRTMRSEMIGWLDTVRFKIVRCLNWLAYDKGLETENLDNCLVILSNMNDISEMLDESIDSILNFGPFRRSGGSIVDLLFSDREFVFTLCIFGVQFIFLLFLVCILLRVW